MKLYPFSAVQMDAVYMRYLGHCLNVLRNCHATDNKYKKHSVNNTMFVWDTGASIGLTPFRHDFIDYLSLFSEMRWGLYASVSALDRPLLHQILDQYHITQLLADGESSIPLDTVH